MAEDKIPKNPFSAVGAAHQLQTRKKRQDEAIRKATESKKTKPKKKTRKKEAPSVAEIKKSRHKGLEGETAFGQRMKESPMGKTKTRFGQTGN